MLKRFIVAVLRPRHYWRSVSFDDIAELYVSRMIMVFAVNAVNLFTAVYLFKLGYSVLFIALFYMALYLMKVVACMPIAKYIAYFGPKHGILTASIIRIPALAAFALAPQFGLAAVVTFGVLQMLAAAMYDMSYMIDFSKVKHTIHAGKEIGVMNIIEKTAKVVSPLAGGLIASFISPQATIIFAGVLFIIAALPLFHTVEPVLTRRKISLVAFPWRLTRATLISQSVLGFDFFTSGVVWTLFITLFIFSGAGDAVYSLLGALTSFGVLVSIVTSWTFGKMIDRRRGHMLLAAGTITNSILHLFRPFIATPAGVIGVNMVNETATTAYVMPYTRAVFDVSDSSGARIAYYMLSEMMLNLGIALACFMLALGVWALGDKDGMILVFVCAAVWELIMLSSTRQAR